MTYPRSLVKVQSCHLYYLNIISIKSRRDNLYQRFILGGTDSVTYFTFSGSPLVVLSVDPILSSLFCHITIIYMDVLEDSFTIIVNIVTRTD